MQHSVIWLDGTVDHLEFRLGSGIFDKYGAEIFEGDLVLAPWYSEPALVIFRDGTFYVNNKDCLSQLLANKLEVVGKMENSDVYRELSKWNKRHLTS